MWKWILRIICLTLQLGPLLRYVAEIVELAVMAGEFTVLRYRLDR